SEGSMTNILVIGKGGRAHALVWKLKQSPRAGRVFCAPGNAGTATDGATNVAIDPTETDKLFRFCAREQIDLIVIGPEDPLAAGLADFLRGKTGLGQEVFVTGGAGTFTLTFDGEGAEALPVNATITQVEVALNALSSIRDEGGSVSVLLKKRGHYHVIFGGTLAATDLPLLIAEGTGGVAVNVGLKRFKVFGPSKEAARIE